MTLRKKTALLVFLLMIPVSIALFAVLSTVFLRDFGSLERIFMEKDIERLERALADLNRELVPITSDWAIWDDAWHFVQGRQPEFIPVNMSVETFGHMELDLIVYKDRAGRELYMQGFDPAQQAIVEPPAGLRDWLALHPHLGALPETTTSEGTGSALLPDGLLFFSARPVVRTNGDGPVEGTVIFGRLLNESRMNQIASLTGLSVEIHRWDDTRLTPEFHDARRQLEESPEPIVRAAGSDTIFAFIRWNDFDGHPVLIARIASPRSIYHRGRASMLQLFGVVLAVNIGFGLAVLLGLERTILRRLSRLGRQVVSVGARGDPADRVTVEGKDEIAGLAGEVRGAFEALARTQADLAVARDQAEAANRAKSLFLANMSHELRTPLNAVVGISELMDSTRLDEKQQDYVRTMRGGVENLLGIINDILDYSKAESGKLDLEARPYNPAEVARFVVKLMAHQAGKKGVKLGAEIDACGDGLIGDAMRLRQVLLNLVGNAIKFTPEGGAVVVKMTRRRIADEHGEWQFEIVDEGIGIPPDRVESLFASYSQADTSIARRFGGTGLGLAISKRLVELMGGVIGVTSVVGKGSCFRFTIRGPACEAPVGAEVEKDAHLDDSFATLHPLRILVAEDRAVNRQVLEHMLARLGYTALFVEDGRDAVEVCARENGSIDVILMDVRMEHMDGLEATRRIRAQGTTDSNGNPVRIVALTAQAMGEDREECHRAGMDGFVSKPVRIGDLSAALRAAPKAAPLQPAAPASKPAESAPFNEQTIATLRECMDESAFRKVLLNWKQESRELHEAIERALEAEDATQLREAAHALKSVCGAVGADLLVPIARRMEQHGREGRIAPARSLLAELKEAFEITMKASARYIPAD